LLASVLGCASSQPASDWEASETSGTDLSTWDNVPTGEPGTGGDLHVNNAAAPSLASIPKGSLPVTLESNCAYAYHIQVKDPAGKLAHDLWIDKGHRRPLHLLPGSRFVFCGQHNECPQKSFYTVPAGPPNGPLRVHCPCSESVIGI